MLLCSLLVSFVLCTCAYYLRGSTVVRRLSASVVCKLSALTRCRLVVVKALVNLALHLKVKLVRVNKFLY
jgi:hypothetical protein